MSCANTCTTNADCTPPNICNNGSCGKRRLGRVCTTNDDCNSGICQQGVCCSTTCTGTCRSCALPGSEGACTNVPERQDPLDQCPDTGAASCGTDGTCDGAGACRFYAKGTTCRAIAGACDVAETCAGGGAPCPTDGFLRGNVCRAVGWELRRRGDLQRHQRGLSGGCARARRAPCAARLAGICDVAETCSGTSAACPADAFAPGDAGLSRVGRSVRRRRDLQRGSGGLPARRFRGRRHRLSRAGRRVVTSPRAAPVRRRRARPTASSRPGPSATRAVDLCDAPETCSGVGRRRARPMRWCAAGTVCRGSAGVCDVAETCTGSSTACPHRCVRTLVDGVPRRRQRVRRRGELHRFGRGVPGRRRRRRGRGGLPVRRRRLRRGRELRRRQQRLPDRFDGDDTDRADQSGGRARQQHGHADLDRGRRRHQLHHRAQRGFGRPVHHGGNLDHDDVRSQRAHQRHHVLLRRVGDDRRSGVRFAQFDAGGGDPQRVPGGLLRRLRGRHPGNAGQRLDASRRQRRRLGGHGGRAPSSSRRSAPSARRSAPRSPAAPPARPGAAPPACPPTSS